jgi:hypothetical protein
MRGNLNLQEYGRALDGLDRAIADVLKEWLGRV